jgi:hypothetical protein
MRIFKPKSRRQIQFTRMNGEIVAVIPVCGGEQLILSLPLFRAVAIYGYGFNIYRGKSGNGKAHPRLKAGGDAHTLSRLCVAILMVSIHLAGGPRPIAKGFVTEVDDAFRLYAGSIRATRAGGRGNSYRTVYDVQLRLKRLPLESQERLRALGFKWRAEFLVAHTENRTLRQDPPLSPPCPAPFVLVSRVHARRLAK